jgi:hypothetical protein
VFQKRKNKLILGIFLLFPLWIYSAELSFIEIPSQDTKIHSLYEQMILTTRPTELVAYSLSGQPNWIVTKNSNFQILESRFNTVLISDDEHSLIAYDVFQGLELWSVKQKNIKNISISYPYIVYQSHQGTVGAVDFLTGQLLWENTSLTCNSILTVGRTSYVVVQTVDGGKIVDITDGSIIFEDTSIISSDELAFTWNGGLLLNRENALFVYDIEPDSLIAVTSNGTGQRKQYEQYHLVFQPTSNQVIVLNMLDPEERVTIDFDNSLKAFATFGDSLYSINDKNELISTNLMSGIHTEERVLIPELDVSQGFNVFLSEENTFLFTKSHVLSIDN